MIISIENFQPTTSQGFIVLEGVNGAGKSTLQRGLKEHFQGERHVVTSFEPGGTPLGQSLRKLLLERSGEPIAPLTEALLFSADRAEHVHTLIRPEIAAGNIVLLDRYYYSTVAFQGYGHGLPITPLLTLSEIATQGLKPDLVLLLDLSPEEGLLRNAGKDEEDRFEDEEIAFHQRIRQGFLELAEQLPEPFAVLDATRPADEILLEAQTLIERVLQAQG